MKSILIGLAAVLLVPLMARHALPAVGAPQPTVVVFAAASLTNVLQDIATIYGERTNARVVFSFAASSTLAKQIESGASAQLFIAADSDWMTYVETRGLLATGTRRDLIGNQLVFVVPADRNVLLDIAANQLWLEQLPPGRIAIGDPAHVPAGKYAEQAFRALGVWRQIEQRLARADNVRNALVLVERGEAAAGVVYKTDAGSSKRVAIAGTFPATSHSRIVYPVALMKGHDTGDARAFYDFLLTPAARDIFARHGFSNL